MLTDCPQLQEERRVSTIKASAHAVLSHKAAKAAVREDSCRVQDRWPYLPCTRTVGCSHTFSIPGGLLRCVIYLLYLPGYLWPNYSKAGPAGGQHLPATAAV